MCDCETPMIELTDLDGSPIGIRRDLIAIVKSNSDNPLGGSVVGTEIGKCEVVETPGEILRRIGASVLAVVDLADTDRAESA